MVQSFYKSWRKTYEKLKNLHFNGLFLTKVYNASAWEVQRSYVDGTQDWLKKIEAKLICCFKNDMNLVNSDLSIQKSPKFALWYVLSINVWPKKVQQSYLSWHQRVMQNLNENWLLLSKMSWGIWEIFTRALGSLKIGILMGFFCPKLKMQELKIYWGVMCHENEEWCKNWRGIDFSVQNWHEQFDQFWFKHSKIYKTCTLMDCLWPKYIMFELKKYRGVWWHWILMQNLKENWLMLSKMTWGIIANFHQSTFESLKIRSLMGSFYPK